MGSRRYISLSKFCWLCLLIVLSSCSNQMEPQTDSSVALPGFGPSFNSAYGRDNPLQTFIRTHWTDGDETNTGGLHYSHIKIYGHNYSNLDWAPDQQEFIADHYDMYAGGGCNVGAIADDDFIWILETALLPRVKVGSYMDNWLNDPIKNPKGYTYDDLVMHYKYNTVNDLLYPEEIPGWNPDDDDDGDGCIEPPDEGCDGLPCDSTRSAICYSDSRIRYDRWKPENLVARFRDPYYLNITPYHFYLISRTIEKLEVTCSGNAKGVHFDAIGTNPGPYGFGALTKMENSFTYDGEDSEAENFPYIIDKYVAIWKTITEAEKEVVEPPIICLANTISPVYTCVHFTQKGLCQVFLENMFNECWMITNGSPDFTIDKIESSLDCPYLDHLEQGRGYIFTCMDQAPDYLGSDRGRGFSLALFYMINHQLAFYYYRTKDHTIDQGDPPVSTLQWNPLVEFCVGQPTTNGVRLPDFQGNMGTDRYFIWKDEQDYKILGRQYMRSDGRKVLVLAKVMPVGGVEGDPASATTHTLPPREWHRLMPDMTWSSPTTQVTLTNNEGAILLNYNGEEPPIPHQNP